MQRTGTFIVGVLTGVTLIGAPALASEIKGWTRGDIEVANDLFAPRSGLHFGLGDAPEHLVVRAHPVANLTQVLRVELPPDPILPPDPVLPPDPIFQARIFSDSTIVLHISHLDQVTLLAPDGSAATLCSPFQNVP